MYALPGLVHRMLRGLHMRCFVSPIAKIIIYKPSALEVDVTEFDCDGISAYFLNGVSSLSSLS